jgi:phthalate 4,5-dioxygenase reductase subunit
MPNEVDETVAMRLRIAAKRRLAADIVGFELTAPDERDLPTFTCGAHVAVRAPNGLLRKYSLCNDPAERHRYVIAVKRTTTSRW